MAHLNHQKFPRAPRVPSQWLPATASLTDWLIRVTGNHELAAKIGPNLAKPVGNAMFVPALSEVQIDSSLLGKATDPASVNFSDDLFQARNPLAVAAAIHESAHSVYSRWMPADLAAVLPKGKATRRHLEIIAMLEEARVEERALRGFPGLSADIAAKFLPSIVFDFLANDIRPDAPRDHYRASGLVALVYTRAQVGIVSEESIASFRERVEEFLSADHVERLLAIAAEFRASEVPDLVVLQEEDALEMFDISERWLAVVADAMLAQREREDSANTDDDGISEEGGSEEHTSDGADALEEILADIRNGEVVMDDSLVDEDDPRHEDGDTTGNGTAGVSDSLDQSIAELAEQAKHEQAMGLLDEVKAIKTERARRARELDQDRRRSASRAAKEAYAKNIQADKIGKSQRVGEDSWLHPRTPTASERTAATQFAKKVMDVVSVEPVVTKVAMARPGKKLRTRALVQRRAQAARGRRPTALHWEGKARQIDDNPKLRVGVAVDVSGSMENLSEPLGLVAYIIGNGVQKSGGDFAQVVFGTETTGIVKNGQRIAAVPVVDPADDSESIKSAVLALDHELNLVEGDGVRVLVVASDGQFVDRDEAKWADEAFPALAERGVIVLHLDMDSQYGPSHYPHTRHNNPYAPLLIPRGTTPQRVAEIVGDRIVEAVAATQRDEM